MYGEDRIHADDERSLVDRMVLSRHDRVEVFGLKGLEGGMILQQ